MNAKELTRQYFNSLHLEQRLMDSCIPNTEMWLFGQKFNTPVMTAALSHLGTFHPDAPNGMVDYAKGAALAGAVHWYGMGEEPEFEAVMATGAKTIRIVKPYADEAKIERQLKHAEELGALAVGMDIDHMFNMQGNPDVCVGEEMSIKSSEDLRRYVEMTKLPFVVKGVLSVHDAVKCAEIGVKGIVVSHHGGRLNDAVPPLFALPDIVKAVGHKMEIFVDCGILSGSDAYKAMALGAKAVSVGIHLIPFVKQGAEAVAGRINDMTAEMKGIMAHTGVKDVKSFDASVVYRL